MLIRLIPLLFLPILCPAQTDAAPSSTDLDSAAMSALREAFVLTAPAYSRDLLDTLATRTGLSRTEVRTRLLVRLDSLEQQREKETEVWQKLTGLGGANLPSETADKLLRNLAREARKALDAKGNVLLDNSVKQATKKTRLYDYQGRDFLLQALDWGLTGSLADAEGQDFGVLVGGHTNRFELHQDPLFVFFDSDDEAYVLEQVREIQRFIVPALVNRLPASKHVRWAVRQRDYNALVEPRYKFVFGVDELTFTGSNLDLRPCVEASIELLAWPDQTPAHAWNFQHCTEKHGSATTHELTPFYDEVAEEVQKLLDSYLGP